MPLYEYECDACGKRFELLQKFSDPPTATCTCGGTAHRQISPSAFQFKGSGWYITDYARKPAPAEKSEARPETTSEPAPKTDEKKPAAAPAKDSP